MSGELGSQRHVDDGQDPGGIINDGEIGGRGLRNRQSGCLGGRVDGGDEEGRDEAGWREDHDEDINR